MGVEETKKELEKQHKKELIQNKKELEKQHKKELLQNKKELEKKEIDLALAQSTITQKDSEIEQLRAEIERLKQAQASL